MAGKSSLRNLQAFSPVQVLSELVQAWQQYQYTVETEQTKRAEIAARRDAILAEIQARRDVLIDYLDRSFDERAQNFRSLFQTVDRAIAQGDNQQLALTLGAIVALGKSSPFHDLADLGKVETALTDPNHVWEI